MFELDPLLSRDTVVVGEWPLSLLLLHRDSNYPWFILVPKQARLTEFYQLASDDQQQLLLESNLLAAAINQVIRPDKLNVAALGNVVAQLHIHHIARFTSDPAWPDPVWGAVPAQRYSDETLHARVSAMRACLADSGLHW